MCGKSILCTWAASLWAILLGVQLIPWADHKTSWCHTVIRKLTRALLVRNRCEHPQRNSEWIFLVEVDVSISACSESNSPGCSYLSGAAGLCPCRGFSWGQKQPWGCRRGVPTLPWGRCPPFVPFYVERWLFFCCCFLLLNAFTLELLHLFAHRGLDVVLRAAWFSCQVLHLLGQALSKTWTCCLKKGVHNFWTISNFPQTIYSVADP